MEMEKPGTPEMPPAEEQKKELEAEPTAKPKEAPEAESQEASGEKSEEGPKAEADVSPGPEATPVHEEPQQPTSVWSLMLGVLSNPAEALAQVARERRVGQAALIVVGLGLFGLITGVLGIQNEDLASMLEMMDIAPDLATFRQVVQQFALVWGILGVLLQVIQWFVNSAIYNLLGEVMGIRPDGRAMLAALGFAHMPAIFNPILEALAKAAGMNSLGFIFTLAIAVWIWVLDVLAIRSALQTSTGKAVAIFLIPAAVIVGLVFLGIVFMVAALAPMF